MIWALGLCLCPMSVAFSALKAPIKQPMFLSSKISLEKKGCFFEQRQENAIRAYSTSLSSMPKGNLPIRIDQPLLSPEFSRRSTSAVWSSLLTMFISDAFKTACLAFIIAFGISFVSKYVKSASKLPLPLRIAINNYKIARGKVLIFLERFKEKVEGEPVEFDPLISDGWGVCTLTSKSKVGRSNFVKYDFSLPKANHILNLALGQQISLCCLDKSENVSKGDFYLFSDRNQLGSFSILAHDVDTNSSQEKDIEVEVGKEVSHFSKVLKSDLEIGDEVAVKPGMNSLQYKGQYLPVTDMVYFAVGSGIVPVLEQVKTVLPAGTSSVQNSSVIWINKSEKDFDVGMKSLEEEYFKYNTKLAVSCIMGDVHKNKFEENKEITDALPVFKPGTMAVISGLGASSEKAKEFLIEKGYSKDCICVLV